MLSSAGKVSSATALSRVLGLVREQVMAFYFGAGMATDAFVIAFRIPNLLRDMFAEGALSSAFVPIFKKKLISESKKEAFHLANLTLTSILTLVGSVVVLGVIASPVIVFMTAYGFTDSPAKFDLTVVLTRIMFAYLLLVSLSALVMGILNSFGRFGIPAISSAMFNLGMILTVMVLYSQFDQPVYTLAIGVLVGGLGQLGIQIPSLYRIGFKFRLNFAFLDEGLKKVYKLALPMIVGMSASRINLLISTLLASFLMEGSISYLNYSFRLMHFPMGVFAVALGTVALPRVSELVSRGDTKELNKVFHEAISLNLFMLIPSAVFLAFMGHEIVALLYQWGEFSGADADNTYLALLHYSYGVVGFASVRVMIPFFYANNDSKLPMKVSLVTVGVNIALYYPMIKILDFAGLAAATSVAGILNALMLIYFVPSKGIKVSYSRLILNSVRIALAAILAFYVGRMSPEWIQSDQPVLSRVLDLAIPSVTAAILFVVLCFIFRVNEVLAIWRRIFRRGSG